MVYKFYLQIYEDARYSYKTLVFRCCPFIAKSLSETAQLVRFFRARHDTAASGEVYLIGGGWASGAFDIRALGSLRQADVVLYDRLITPVRGCAA